MLTESCTLTLSNSTQFLPSTTLIKMPRFRWISPFLRESWLADQSTTPTNHIFFPKLGHCIFRWIFPSVFLTKITSCWWFPEIQALFVCTVLYTWLNHNSSLLSTVCVHMQIPCAGDRSSVGLTNLNSHFSSTSAYKYLWFLINT